jgi:hypothetical protein
MSEGAFAADGKATGERAGGGWVMPQQFIDIVVNKVLSNCYTLETLQISKAKFASQVIADAAGRDRYGRFRPARRDGTIAQG